VPDKQHTAKHEAHGNYHVSGSALEVCGAARRGSHPHQLQVARKARRDSTATAPWLTGRGGGGFRHNFTAALYGRRAPK